MMDSIEIILNVISVIIDIIALILSGYSLFYVIKISKRINFTDNSKVNNKVSKNRIGGDYIGRDKNR